MQYRSVAVFALPLFLATLLVACGGDDDDANDADATSTSPANAAATSSDGGGAAGGAADDLEEIDVCALLTQAEVEAAIGQTAGPGAPEESFAEFGLGGGACRFEADDITPVVTVSVLAWSNEEDADASFSFGEDQYPPVEGIGDRAYRSQPIDEISVLVGRYELSVGLYFVSEDDDEEFEMSRQLAELVISRLP
jgi:hypothetical protein